MPIPETLPGAHSAVARTFKAPLVQQSHAAEIAGRDVVLPARYALVGRIASGSFGEVWRVNDCVLDRVLAMKVQRSELCRSQHLRARFLTEARITADLQHPGIVAVHDQGELDDGRLWFTMKEVRGRTLRDVINEVHAASDVDGFREAGSGWTFRRLLDAFARICQAVAFAHSRGVMHRDLKPDNLMVGEFGEVLVMDWGLARRVGVKEDTMDGSKEDDMDFVSEDLPASLTRMGDILGTPAYMPPEQARGQRELHGPHSDVYALGAILFHLLSGRVPYDGSSVGVLRQVINGPPPPLAEVLVARPPVPAELVALCERAMAREIRDRYPDAEPLARELFAFLEGARRREQALAVLAEARAIEPKIADLRRRAALRREEAQALLAGVQPFDPIEKKRPGWELEDESARLGREAALHETEWLQTVHGALTLYPELPEAHALLADHYSERLSAAELAHHDEDAARYQALVRAHDRGRHTAFLRGEGSLTLSTEPPGAVVRVERYALHDRRLVPIDEGVLGTTPLRAVPIVRGSYRLRVQAPGRAEVIYPVLIERGNHWEACAPGEREPHPLVLPVEGELGPDDCYVPAGFCWIGGDSEAGDSLPASRVWIDGFVMRRFPVTNQEYVDFLNDLVAARREADAIAACPKSAIGMGDARAAELALRRDPEGRFLLTPGEQDADAPVVAIDWYSATAYAEWLAKRTGKPWRLPNELEREKAARGVDGRFGPWGDHLDATFACTADSKSGELVVARVTDYPLDESPYGIRGLAGNVREWCANIWRREGPRVDDGRLSLAEEPADGNALRSVRGGAWMSPLNTSRSAFRFAARADLRRVSVGMRLVRSL
ncbi:serine/threonine protein kinase [Minicystis rosea]|nr:serine/threonine protein kinase [Minicystis rosea]